MSNAFLGYGVLTKAEQQDDGTIIVKGVASTESLDSEGEIVTADAMRKAIPDYMRFGAVREMHGDIAAGTAISIGVDDEGVTQFEAHIVDPVAVKKVQHGVYKGFSVGGRKIQRDELNKRKITQIKLTEISLVDRPANPDAVFELAKFDKETGEDLLIHMHVMDGASVEKALGKVAAREDVSPKEGKEKYGDVEFADAKNKKYPIDKEERIRAAWNYINKEKNAAKYSAADLKTIKGKIVSAWKSKIDKDGPPSAEAKKADNGGPMGDELRKDGLYSVQNFASLLCSLGYLAQDNAMEQVYEGDASPVPGKLRKALEGLVDAFKAMATEEADEMLEGIRATTGVPDVLAMAKETEDLRKKGAAFSASTKEKMAKAHDHIKAADAAMSDTGYDKPDEKEDDDAKKGEGLAKMAEGLNERLTKLESEAKEKDDLLAKAAERLTKYESEAKEAQEAMEALLGEVQKLAPASHAGTVLSKADDASLSAKGTVAETEDERLKKSDNPKDAIKFTLRNGGRLMDGSPINQ